MKRWIFYISIFIFTLFIFGCCNKKGAVSVSNGLLDSIVTPQFLKQYPNFDKQTLTNNLQEYIKADSDLYRLYSENNFTPIWTGDTLNISSLKELIMILNSIEEHGLTKDIFDREEIEAIATSIDTGAVSDSLLYTNLVKLDQVATKSAVKYIEGMTYGFIRPDTLFKPNYNIKTLRPDSAFAVRLYNDLKTDAVKAMFNSQPKDSVYLKMQKSYEFWKNKEGITLSKINANAGSQAYKFGDTNDNISKIAQRLIFTGEFVPDTANTDSLYRTMTVQLLDAVNTFRRHNSYPEEMEVGALTIEALNRPPSYYINTIRANMERHRWQKANERNLKHIEVNVAAFSLVATQPDTLPLTMRVCVGSVKHKTPLLESVLGYINLNPTWNVPISIAKNEIFIGQKRDSSYMQKRNMRLYKGGKEVEISSVDWENIDPTSHGYFVRQDQGDGNSLGKLKFMFNNAFSVYLHDTPSKRAFSRKNRAVSHGCIRLQQPVDLAFFCTSPSTDLYKDQLRHAIRIPPKTAEGKKMLEEEILTPIKDIINLKERISLSIDYHTAFMYPGSKTLYFADDVYGYDKKILDALGSIPVKVENNKKL